MFRGNHPAKVEESGRLKLPTAFKEIIDAAGISQFYVTSTKGESAEIWPLGEWEKQEAELVRASIRNPKVKKFLNRTSYYGQQIKIDAQGRMVLPQILREAAKLGSDVVVLGNVSYLEVFNREFYEKSMAEDELTDDDLTQISELLNRPVAARNL